MGATDMPDPVDPPDPTDPDPVDPPADPPEPPTDPVDPPELAKWKAMARKHEAEAKKNAKALADAQAATLSDTEKAIKQARDEGLAEGTKSGAVKIAEARIEAALTGVVPDPSAIVEDIDVSKYLTDTGEVDTEKIGALKAKYVALAKPAGPGSGDGGGQGPAVTPLALEAQIAEARKAGDHNRAIALEMQKLLPTGAS